MESTRVGRTPVGILLLAATMWLLVCPHVVVAYTESIRYTRKLPSSTVEQTYARCVQAWRHENLGLPRLFSNAFLRKAGDDTTGVGLEVIRFPPAGLREGVVGCKQEDGSMEMEYRILNPGPATWPVEKHRGRVVMVDDGNNGCSMEWIVEWTPLQVPLPFFQRALKLFTRFIIGSAVEHVCKGDPEYCLNPTRTPPEFASTSA